MKYDFFISGRYRNKTNILDLIKRIRSQGKTAYSFIESPASLAHVGGVDDDTEQMMKQFEEIPDWWNDARVREIFETDMAAERAADTFVLLLPAGKSAHLEAGVAYGLGKRCILIGKQEATESLYLIFSEHYDTVDDFLKTLS